MLGLLLPQRCLLCGHAGVQLCARCRDALPVLPPPLCTRCGAPTAWPVARCRECSGRRLAFASARAAVAYDEDVRRLVGGWKERGLRRLADAAAAAVVDRVPRPEAEVLTFVPADRSRKLVRGYHPAEQLARSLARSWSLPCEPLLRRSGTSRRQQGLPLAERRRNVAGAFTATSPVEGRAVLVDDVYTTGSTVHAAAAALSAHVDVVTFARAVRSLGLGHA